MARGGKRPGAGAKKGGTRSRKPRVEIAERRRLVHQLSLVYRRPAEILAAIQREQPQILEGLRSPYEVILQDLARIQDEYVEALRNGTGLEIVGHYVESVDQLRRMLLGQFDQLGNSAKVQAIKALGNLAGDIARARGMPTDRPALPLDLNDLTLPGTGQESTRPPFPGMVDALTFAMDPRFCALADIPERFPMQHRVLTEFMAPDSRYRVLVLVCGMRSGKGVAGSVLAWYAAYELLQYEDPQSYFGLTPNQEIQIVNLATSRSQAKNNVFKHILDRLETGGAWFAALRKQAKITGLEVRLPKNIVIRCGHSQATHQVGATSYMVILDELARFKDTEGRDNADQVYDKMSATTATFPQRGRVLVLTSPEWEADKAMRLLVQALEVDGEGRPVQPHMLGRQMATWEANRNLSQVDLWERFNGDANPSAFWRDFGARPPFAVEGYYPDPERWDRQGDPERQHPYDEAGQLADSFRPCCDSKRFVHVDLGATRDACGLAMAHMPVPGCPWYGKVDGEPNRNARRIVVDVVFQLAPPRQREQRGEISFERVRQIIRDWQDRGFSIKGGLVSYDGWQSLDSQQILKREGFRVREFSLDRDTKGHDTLQELVNTDRLGYYAHPVLIREAKQLSLVKGRKVEHPKGGSKDVVDAVAGAVYHALKLGGRLRFVG